MIHVAMLSRWHVHADDYAGQVEQHPKMKIAAVWDELPERGEAWAADLGVPFASDYETLLADDAIDAVIVCAPTVMHKTLIEAAARSGKHVFTEKILALTVEQCDEIFAAVRQANVHLVVSLPRLAMNFYIYAQGVLDRGLLGDLTAIRCRHAHHGAVPEGETGTGWLPAHFFDREQSGGGALVDLGAHPIYLGNPAWRSGSCRHRPIANGSRL